ncbi:MAG: bacterial Ig-like domain-containing protein [Clostridia bacterium]|nr:bacterial Ig-like domain-containing protein [Clostridia bacterium]
MKKFISMIIAITLMFGLGIGLAGCDAEVSITAISIKSGTLATEYYVDDNFSVEDAVIVVTYSDNTTEEITSDDVDFETIFETISTETAGTKVLQFTYGGKTATLTIKVYSSLTDEYEINGFEQPAFVTNYKYYKSVKPNNKETEFYNRTVEYKVGDDNPFIFLPIITAVDEEENLITPSAYVSNVIVELKNNETGEFEVLTGEDLTDMVRVSTTESSFDFTETAIGETFRITVRPEFVEASELPNGALSFSFTVVDGWNAYDVADLSRINNNATTELDWASYKNANSIGSEQINALILHNDITITASDLPASYIWQENEVSGSADYDISLGSLKDWKAIYTRMVGAGDDIFTLSGNYFTIDASAIPLIVRDGTTPLASNEYNEGLIANSLLFGFTGDKDGTTTDVANGKCVMENLNIIGNSNRSEDIKNLGGLTMVNTTSSDFVADNVISKSFFTNYTTQRAGADGKDSKTTLNDCKTYDSFSCMLYLFGCETNDVTNSEFKRAGGPITLVCTVETGSYKNYGNINFTDCNIENFVTGTEAWFSINNASSLVTDIATMNQLIAGYSGGTKSIMNSESKLNFITAMIDGDNTLTFEDPLQGATTIDNGEEINDTALDMGALNSNPYLADLITAGAPILQSSAGGLGYINDAPSIQTILNEPDNNNGLYQGDYMYLYLKAGSQYIGACVEYFDIVAS